MSNPSTPTTLQLISYHQCLVSYSQLHLLPNFTQILKAHQIIISPFHKGFIIKLKFLNSLKRYFRQHRIKFPEIAPISLKLYKQAYNNNRQMNEVPYDQRHKQLSQFINSYKERFSHVYLHRDQIIQIQQFCLLSKKYIIGNQGFGKTITTAVIIRAMIDLQKSIFEQKSILLILPKFLTAHWCFYLQKMSLYPLSLTKENIQKILQNKKTKSKKNIYQVYILSYEELGNMNDLQRMKITKVFRFVTFDQISFYLFSSSEKHLKQTSFKSQKLYEYVKNIINLTQNVLILDSRAKNFLQQLMCLIFKSIPKKELNQRYFNDKNFPQINVTQFWRTIQNSRLYIRNIKNPINIQLKDVYLQDTSQITSQTQNQTIKIGKKYPFLEMKNFDNTQLQENGTVLTDQTNQTYQCQKGQFKSKQEKQQIQESEYDDYCKKKAVLSIDYIKYKLQKAQTPDSIIIVYQNQWTKIKLNENLMIQKELSVAKSCLVKKNLSQFKHNSKLRFIKINYKSIKRIIINFTYFYILQLGSIQIRPNYTFLFVQFFLPKMKQILEKNLSHQFITRSKVQILRLHPNPFQKEVNIKKFISNNSKEVFQLSSNNIKSHGKISQLEKKLTTIQSCLLNEKNLQQQQKICQVNSTNSSVRGQIDSRSNSKSDQTNQNKAIKNTKQNRGKIICINLQSGDDNGSVLALQQGANKKNKKKNKLDIKKKTRIVYFDAQVKEDAIRILSESQQQNDV